MTAGVVPAARVELGETRLCGSCATLVRYHPAESAWRHCIVGLDHPPELLGSTPAIVERDAPIVTEAELRLLDGNR